MRRAPLVVCLCVLVLSGTANAGQRTTPGSGKPVAEPAGPDRVSRLDRWIRLVAGHTPGEIDPQLEEIASWPNADLKQLWLDAEALVNLIRANHKLTARVTVRYLAGQEGRVRALACAADGAIFDNESCKIILSAAHLDDELLRVSELSRASNLHGDHNYVLRRGALLHSDVGMLAPFSMTAPFDARPTAGPQSYRMEISDGRSLELQQTAVHWEIARMLLDSVMPPGTDRVAPSADPMVRQWYRATSAWMQFREDHNELHLERARRLFPEDPEILFLSACQRETFGGAPIQTALRSAVLPTGVTMGVNSDQWEWREAERFFSHALRVKPDYAEARMRHGRVLGELGKHAEAAVELRRARPALEDEQQRYYAELFLGAEEEALGNRDEARAAYERAAALFPRAQSPLLALSQLARRSGDRSAALRAMDRVFALSAEERAEHDDPWWWYYVVQGRDADDLLEAMRQPYLEGRIQ